MLFRSQPRLLLDSHAVASKLNLTRSQALEYANLARSLERMMDHINNITLLLHDHPEFVGQSKAFAPMDHVPGWMEALKELMINIRTRDSERIEQARHALKEIQQALRTYERTMLSSSAERAELAWSLSIAESIRRLCAYSRDFGEVLLNMKISTEMKVVR